ncbi:MULTISPECIES: trans-acting enoyl reductase family protein [Actinomycetes]|uniref:saccharopine dehydrogenase family protein n=1 Tax=Actinomycetes TaxID=1760 RepID=UPI0001B55AD0|nr:MULTISPECIES: saccharopine dehydrogenase NADP-binding domain-containing protein [Actinomycetes]EFL07323.1 saccharopine dehydrogenase [Streptomyces sp. AA4]
MTGRLVVFGATGYTGGLVTESLVRHGVRPVLAGRNRSALEALAATHGDLETAVADVRDPASLRSLAGPGDVLIATVGPFERIGHAAAQAAADAGAHYLDSTGEVGFVRTLRARHHERATETGAAMVPAFGYDYVPGILAGALAAQEAGEGVRSLEIGYFATGPFARGLSQGTRATMRDGLTLPSLRWRGRRLVEERTGSRVRSFPVRGRSKAAFLVSGTEVLFLPGISRRWTRSLSTMDGFPALSRAMPVVSALASVAGPVLRALSGPMAGPPGGPDAAARAKTGAQVVAIADSRIEVRLEGPNAYTLTGDLLAWAAIRLSVDGPATPGVVGPVDAFGLEPLRDGCAELGLVRQVP